MISRPIDVVLARLECVRGSNTTCPACKNRGALVVRETSDGTVLLKCSRGCNAATIAVAAGISLRALFVARTTPEDPRRTA